MFFKNRSEAGKQLAAEMIRHKNKPDAIILALPRGGVVVGSEMAKSLNLPLDVICARKVGAPHNPELAIGAITEIGEGYFNEDLIRQIGISKAYIQTAVEQETKEAKRRLNLYRQNRPPLVIKGKTVILVDDGIATGATMKASIQSVKTLGPKKIIVAVPVSSADTLMEIEGEVDEAIALLVPDSFYAVGEFYLDFSQTSDEEVIRLLSHS